MTKEEAIKKVEELREQKNWEKVLCPLLGRHCDENCHCFVWPSAGNLLQSGGPLGIEVYDHYASDYSCGNKMMPSGKSKRFASDEGVLD
jgi:hypothetical protein